MMEHKKKKIFKTYIMEFKVTNSITKASVKQHHASPPPKLAGKMAGHVYTYIYTAALPLITLN